MKRYQSRNISRSRSRVQALNPCSVYASSAGRNPFEYLFQRLALMAQIAGRTQEDAEKAAAHQIKMSVEQKSARARQERKRNKV